MRGTGASPARGLPEDPRRRSDVRHSGRFVQRGPRGNRTRTGLRPDAARGLVVGRCGHRAAKEYRSAHGAQGARG